MRKIITSLFLIVLLNSIVVQIFNNDFVIVEINQLAKDLPHDNPHKSSLDNYVACLHLWASGKYDSLYSQMIDTKISRDFETVSHEYAQSLLNTEILEVITYKDSVSYIIAKTPGKDYLRIATTVYENGKWKANGENISFGIGNARNLIIERSCMDLAKLRKYYKVTTVSKDTASFINYLNNYSNNPKAYLLEKLTNHKLVIYGEIHRRKTSWDFLKDVVSDKHFAEICGTIFLELPSHTHEQFKIFFANEQIDMEIVMNILRSEQIYGWQDKGQYEFIEKIWEINKLSDKKLQIIPVDFQIPWDSIKTNDELNIYPRSNRDSTMANIIENVINTKIDNRNSLFVVGMNHARKVSPGDISRNNPVKAGTLLAERFSKADVFSIMPHGMIGNNIQHFGLFRQGLFDYVFEQNSDIPIAFDLSNSPFGAEPFDALLDLKYDPASGNYEDFYDGYIFLGPLREEKYHYTLFEMFTDEFVEELKRRALIYNSEMGWYDIPAENLSKEQIINALKKAQKEDRFFP